MASFAGEEAEGDEGGTRPDTRVVTSVSKKLICRPKEKKRTVKALVAMPDNFDWEDEVPVLEPPKPSLAAPPPGYAQRPKQQQGQRQPVKGKKSSPGKQQPRSNPKSQRKAQSPASSSRQRSARQGTMGADAAALQRQRQQQQEEEAIQRAIELSLREQQKSG